MSLATKLAKEYGALYDDEIELFVMDEQELESFYHAARAEALREAAKSIESVDPFSFAIELLRAKAKMEENQ